MLANWEIRRVPSGHALAWSDSVQSSSARMHRRRKGEGRVHCSLQMAHLGLLHWSTPLVCPTGMIGSPSPLKPGFSSKSPRAFRRGCSLIWVCWPRGQARTPWHGLTCSRLVKFCPKLSQNTAAKKGNGHQRHASHPASSLFSID